MKRSQFVIAVFDEWDAVERLFASLGSDKIGRFGALLHTRTDEPPMLAVSWLVQDMRELHFAASRSRVRCTAGVLAAQLAMRSAAGASDLAHALRGWVSPEQAKELQSHVERGRLMLWLQPSRPEDFETVCAQMVQTSPHLVELSNFNVYLGEPPSDVDRTHHAIEDMRFPKYCSFVRCYPPGSLCATGSRQSAAWS